MLLTSLFSFCGTVCPYLPYELSLNLIASDTIICFVAAFVDMRSLVMLCLLDIYSAFDLFLCFNARKLPFSV